MTKVGPVQDTIFVCNTCCLEDGQHPGPALYVALQNALADTPIDVRLVSCMNLCDRPVSLGLRGIGKTGYLFGDVLPGDVDSAAVLARLYAATTDGEIADARPIGRLRHCLIGKLPAV